MTSVLPRRALLLLGASTAMAGCGFQPVYMPTASGQAGPAERDLAAIYVTPMGERPGMLMRQALLDRFAGDGSIVEHRYDLTVSYSTTGTVLGIQPNSTATRVRMIGYASWDLTAADPGRTRLLNGTARAVDSLNALDSQFFVSGLQVEVIQKRLAEALADQIALQLAAYFRKRAAPTAAS
jgi:LPS-assembly lipoprotein